MTKARSDAKWHGLSTKQRGTLEQWIHEDGLSYGEALERAKKEMGFTGSRSGLQRFFERTRDERLLRGLTEAGKLAASVEGAVVSVDELRNAGLKLAAQILLKQVAESPQTLKEWLPLAKLLVQAERNTTWERVKDEENELRVAALNFARARYQYDTIAEAMKALPELKEWEESLMDAGLTKFESNKRMNDTRRRMFGDVIPELLPENEFEEAHPEVIEQRFKEACQRQQEQIAREYQERQREIAESNQRKAAQGITPIQQAPPSVAGTVVPAEGDDELEEPDSVEQAEEAGEEFLDEPKKLTAEERQRNYEELMKRARGQVGR